MRDQLLIFDLTMCGASGNAISSPESPAGPLPCNSLAGPTTAKSGPVPAHASRLAALEKDWERLTKDTYGLISATSSASAALNASLESKWAARLAAYGSPEYKLIWKKLPMPSGGPLLVQQVSARRTSDGEFTGWPSPNTPNGGRTAHEMSTTGMMPDGTKRQAGLEHVVKATGWPSPRAEDSEQTGAHHGNLDTLNSASKAAGWGTPRQTDAKCGHHYTENTTGTDPAKDATMADWNTPHCPRKHDSDQSQSTYLDRQVSGAIPPGTIASTEKPAASQPALNPFFSSWLQGFPTAWTLCGRKMASRFARKSKGERRS
jgi:hypothetical protein